MRLLCGAAESAGIASLPDCVYWLRAARVTDISSTIFSTRTTSGISGGDLTWLAQLQAYRFGAKFSTPSQALSLNYNPDGEYRACIEIEGCPAILRAKTVLIATGADYRRLDAENRERFEGVGVYYAATALEGQICRNETVIVVGSGNSAGQAAMFLSDGAAKVLLVIRGDDITKKMSEYLSRRV